jgi:hypothetical protein
MVRQLVCCHDPEPLTTGLQESLSHPFQFGDAYWVLSQVASCTQFNRGEGRHSVARVVFSGKRGELRQRYREGQEDQLGALGLVVNMIVLWNTIYVEAVLEQFRKEGYPVNEEDKARIRAKANHRVD